MEHKYQTRSDLINHLTKIERALSRGEKTRRVHKYIQGVLRLSEIPWESKAANETSTGKKITDVLYKFLWENEHEEGITFREVESRLFDGAHSLTVIKSAIKADSRFKTEELKSRRKIYGNYPQGIYLVESEDSDNG